jgi:GMP synthase-like glutamine amidotransferase
MEILVFQHHPLEGLGTIKDWLESHQASITYHKFFEDQSIPNIDDYDGLIIMGGPMSVNDEDEHPWITDAVKTIKRAIDSNKKVLGICLGAQLIAKSLGAIVKPNQHREIGLHPISPVKTSNTDVFTFPNPLNVIHWHSQTFDIPLNATHIAQSEACTNQGFQMGKNAIGLQFHLELDKDSLKSLIKEFKDQLIQDQYVHNEGRINSITNEEFEIMQKSLINLLNYLFNK